MNDAPERIDVLMTPRGDLAIDSRGEPLNGGIGDRHVEYVRATALADARRALEEAAQVAEIWQACSDLSGARFALRGIAEGIRKALAP
jgi:hypothetical protein